MDFLINFPIFKKLSVHGYALYKGIEGSPGLEIDFSQQGLTLVLGANGLGKTTLINLMFRMLSGPFDLSKFDEIDELGNRNIISVFRKDLRSFFAERVHDNAVAATATLEVCFGNVNLTISRNLNNLDITDLKIEQTLLPLINRKADEELFQKEITSLASIDSFGDWLLILHYIVFYQENRRALVWDVSAQRELLRILLLNSDNSSEWRDLSRQVLELDSEYRNFRYTANKQIKKLKEKPLPEDNDGLKSEAIALKTIRLEKINHIENIEKEIYSLYEKRNITRSLRLRAKQEIDSLENEINKNKDNFLNSALPNASDALRFILSNLKLYRNNLFDDNQYKHEKKLDWIEKHLNRYINILFKRKEMLNYCDMPSSEINVLTEKLRALKESYEIALKEDKEIDKQLSELYLSVDNHKREIAELNFRLMPIDIKNLKEGDVTSSVDLQISSLEKMLLDKQYELNEADEKFRQYIKKVENIFLSSADAIKNEFTNTVQDFLIEENELTWHPQAWKLSQTNSPVNFPAFIFKMKSGGNTLTTERNSSFQVSESQREFIDLAFRISLINIAGSNSSGSIVMDTPEASLDAIFVKNAAKIFINFSNKNHNKLLLTSNLVDSELLPRLIANLKVNDNYQNGVVNLLEIASPSKAVLDNKEEYKNKYDEIIKKSESYKIIGDI